MNFTTKDSGERVEFASGMRRDTDKGKPRYDLIPTMPLRRLAELYARGAEKYGAFNWQNADSEEELQRFKASCFRHLMQAMSGETDEDHWAAVTWNAFAVMWLEDKLGRDSELERLLAEDEEIEQWQRAQKSLDEMPDCANCGGNGLFPGHMTCRRCHGSGKQGIGPTRFEINEGHFNDWARRQRELARVDL